MCPVDEVVFFNDKIGYYDPLFGSYVMRVIDTPISIKNNIPTAQIDGSEVELTRENVKDIVFGVDFKTKGGKLLKKVDEPLKDKDHYFLARNPPSDYELTDHQKKIQQSGNEIRKQCSGLKGSQFKKCRSDVLSKLFREESNE